MEPALDPVALNRLKWRCRRGLVENDLLIERYFARHGACITARQADGLTALMELPDNDLLDLLLRRREPEGRLARDDVIEVLGLLRTPVANDHSRAAQTRPTTGGDKPGSPSQSLSKERP